MKPLKRKFSIVVVTLSTACIALLCAFTLPNEEREYLGKSCSAQQWYDIANENSDVYSARELLGGSENESLNRILAAHGVDWPSFQVAARAAIEEKNQAHRPDDSSRILLLAISDGEVSENSDVPSKSAEAELRVNLVQELVQRNQFGK